MSESKEITVDEATPDMLGSHLTQNESPVIDSMAVNKQVSTQVPSTEKLDVSCSSEQATYTDAEKVETSNIVLTQDSSPDMQTSVQKAVGAQPTGNTTVGWKAVLQRSGVQSPTVQQVPTQKPAVQKPAPQQPAVQKPATQQPAVQKPAIQQPAVQKPTPQQPAVQKPATQQPAVQKPATQQPAVQKPTPQQPAVQKPATQQPAVQKPSTQQPAVQKPATQQPAVQKPAIQQPAVQKPAPQKPAVQKPAIQQPAVQNPATQKPAVQKPAIQQPAVQNPATQQPAVQKPAIQQPAVQNPATQQPAVQKPATQQPAVQKPATQQPAVQKPATQQPAVQKPATQQLVVQKPVAQKPVKALSDEEVTGHTASLWKYLPLPENEPDPAPEYRSGTSDFPGAKVIAARVRGKKHKHEGTHCDDWYEVGHLDRITFIAVSDGAGSKKFSRIGARISCQAVIRSLTTSFIDLFTKQPELKDHIVLDLSDSRCMSAYGILAVAVQKAMLSAYDAVEAAFTERKGKKEYEDILGRPLEFKDLSSTLLVAVMIPISDTTKEHLVISCQIGDGMIAIFNTEGEFSSSMKLMGEPDSGDFSGETDFLTSAKMKEIQTLQSRTKISRSVVDTVLVMTDGVADDYFPNDTEMRRLYFDLCVNGILDFAKGKIQASDLPTSEQIRLFKKIPNPLIYPWVNNQNVRIAIQYTNRILQATGLTLQNLWDDISLLTLAKLELGGRKENESPSDKLKIWLDNYVERGSFDDRTLVIAKM